MLDGDHGPPLARPRASRPLGAIKVQVAWWVPAAAALACVVLMVVWKIIQRTGARQPVTPRAQARSGPVPAIRLPRPGPDGVPDTWRNLTLGMRSDEIPATQILPAPVGADPGTALYVPDPQKPGDTLELAFASGRLWRIVQHIGRDSGIDSGNVLAPAMRMYGAPRGYEYAAADGGHLVTLFADTTRAFKVDSLKSEGGGVAEIYELSLTDLEHSMPPASPLPSATPAAGHD